MHFLDVLFVRDFYDPIWPNIAASAITGFVVLKRVKVHLTKLHNHQMKWIRAIHGATVPNMKSEKPSDGAQR